MRGIESVDDGLMGDFMMMMAVTTTMMMMGLLFWRGLGLVRTREGSCKLFYDFCIYSGVRGTSELLLCVAFYQAWRNGVLGGLLQGERRMVVQG
jgi:hypothetical protein